MSRSSIKISHIVLNQEEYRRLKIYAIKYQLTTYKATSVLINFFPEDFQTRKKLNKNYPSMFPRRFLHIFLDVK
ncbi:MAG: hypothetical protein FWK04_23130 [Nostoc sp. GBBB01]|nr:hypothetical protein [Nostoc sp. GBBB01]